MLELVMLLIVLVGGRLLPFCTRNVPPGFQPRKRAWVERASYAVLLVLVAVEVTGTVPAAVTATLWLSFVAVQALRLAGWTERRVRRKPVLWVLLSLIHYERQI